MRLWCVRLWCVGLWAMGLWGMGQWGLAVQTKHELAPLPALGQSTIYNLATMETHTPRHTYLPAFLIGPMIKIFFLHLQKTCKKKGAYPPKR